MKTMLFTKTLLTLLFVVFVCPFESLAQATPESILNKKKDELKAKHNILVAGSYANKDFINGLSKALSENKFDKCYKPIRINVGREDYGRLFNRSWWPWYPDIAFFEINNIKSVFMSFYSGHESFEAAALEVIDLCSAFSQHDFDKQWDYLESLKIGFLSGAPLGTMRGNYGNRKFWQYYPSYKQLMFSIVQIHDLLKEANVTKNPTNNQLDIYISKDEYIKYDGKRTHKKAIDFSSNGMTLFLVKASGESELVKDILLFDGYLE